jgi:hypothetical protein
MAGAGNAPTNARQDTDAKNKLDFMMSSQVALDALFRPLG